jgi:hypothetical protein
VVVAFLAGQAGRANEELLIDARSGYFLCAGGKCAMATQIISNFKLAPLTPALGAMTEWLRLMHPEPFFSEREASGRRRNESRRDFYFVVGN